MSAGSYALNQIRKGEDINTNDLIANTIFGAGAGVAGNLFRYNSTGALKDVGEDFINKGWGKIMNGISNNQNSTIKRGFDYIDKGISTIYQYAKKAGANSGFGSAIGNFVSGLWGGIFL